VGVRWRAARTAAKNAAEIEEEAGAAVTSAEECARERGKSVCHNPTVYFSSNATQAACPFVRAT
jgi:hypothetical protein